MADGSKNKPRDLTKLQVFTEADANCGACELKVQCDKGYTVYSYKPAKFNGLMIVGEGPGQQEVAEGRPFVGQSGKLLRALLKSVGLDLDECYIANATLCKPPPKEKSLHEEFPNAVPSCLGRLEAEIEAVKPRVIVTLGSAALIALTGYDKSVIKRTPFACVCDPLTRKIGPVLECSNKIPNEAGVKEKCGAIHEIGKQDPDKLYAKGCQLCFAPFAKGVKPKMVKCLECNGLKTRQQEHVYFEYDYNISDVAGAIFEPAKGEVQAEHEVSAWFATVGVKYIIATYHPSFLLRDKQFMAKPVQKHLLRAAKLLKTDLPWKIEHEVTRDPLVVQKFHRAAKRLDWNIACDIETEARGPDGSARNARKVYLVTKIKCIGFAANGRALVVDTSDVDPSKDSPLLDAIQDLLEDPEVPKTWHNGACYDYPVISNVWGMDIKKLMPSYADDTLNAHANLYPDEPHDLPHVTFSFLPARAWKPARTSNGAEVHESDEELWLYNARDVINTDKSREAMGVDGGYAIEHGKMHRNKLHRCYEQASKIRRIATKMTMFGMPLDQNKSEFEGEMLTPIQIAGRVADRHVNAAIEKARKHLAEATGLVFTDEKTGEVEEFNPFKVKNHLIPALFSADGFNMAPMSMTKTGPCTDEEDLGKLLASVDHKDAMGFIAAILEVRDHNKTRSTYIYSADMQPWGDGRIHPIWKPWGAKTGRWTSSPNAQNWPKWLRVIVAAMRGRKLVGFDYDQLELRGMAALTGDSELIRRSLEADGKRKLEPEWDLHSFVASIAFGGQFTELSLKDPKHFDAAVGAQQCKCQTCKRKAFRDVEKTVIYALNYGAADAKILATILGSGSHSGLPITLEMVAHIRRTIYKEFPGVPKWRDLQLVLAKETQELRSPLYDRRRIFPFGEIPPTEIYNYPNQALGGDVVNERTIILDEELEGVDPTAGLFAQVHDFLGAECDEDHADDVCALMNEVLPCKIVVVPGAPAMHFDGSAGIADNWKDA